jgi:dissimilatory sulfite reductase (desulfoviridin) alpha/beta subunit
MRDTIDMAREAGAIHIHERPKEFAIVGNDSIKAFEALVRADEREACAKVCDVEAMRYREVDAFECAAAIRARGNT